MKKILLTFFIVLLVVYISKSQSRPYILKLIEQTECGERIKAIDSSDSKYSVVFEDGFEDDSLTIFVNNKKVEEAVFTTDYSIGRVAIGGNILESRLLKAGDEIRIVKTHNINSYISFTINKKFHRYYIDKKKTLWNITLSNCIYIYK